MVLPDSEDQTPISLSSKPNATWPNTRGDVNLQYGAFGGGQGAGKDGQEVLRRNMAPRLQVELAFGVLTASVSLGSILQPKVS